MIGKNNPYFFFFFWNWKEDYILNQKKMFQIKL